jgi:hypothetical protein
MVNKSETAKLLAKMQLIDNRKVDRATVEAWHEAIGHQDYADALEALDRHRRTSDAYLMPSHINVLCAAVKQDRDRDRAHALALKALPPPPAQAPPEWFASGRPRITPKPPEVDCPWCGAHARTRCTVRGTERPTRFPHPSRIVYAIRCPQCEAPPGSPCTGDDRLRPDEPIQHQARIEAASEGAASALRGATP